MDSREAQQAFEEAFGKEENLLDDAQTSCDCGWNGKGTGPKGKIVKGDRCPNCGETLS